MALTGQAQAERTLFRGAASMCVEEGTTIVGLRGHIDVTTLPQLVDVFAAAIADRTGPVVVDLAQAGFIDVACARAVGSAAHGLALHDRRLTVRSPSRVALMLLCTLGLSALVEPDAELKR